MQSALCARRITVKTREIVVFVVLDPVSERGLTYKTSLTSVKTQPSAVKTQADHSQNKADRSQNQGSPRKTRHYAGTLQASSG